ncbi:hypothetical protein LJC63_06410 [Ruminococcaceae bacterium OttesenSCG-928-L11]|nr:hypothetical protein [Ruminococcaceae bacterium OttesenSCG-928-L11]
MNKRERVLNAMNCLPVDRPPVGFWFHFSGEEAKGQACIDAHLRFYNNSKVDFAKVMCDSYFPFPIPESIKEPADWATLQPIGRDHPFIQEQLARAKGVKEGLQEDICVFYNVFAPFSSIRFGSSDEFVMRSLREAPEAVAHALNVIGQDNALLAELMVTEAGMDGVYYCVQGGEGDRFTYEEYRRLITPSDKMVLEHVNRFSTNNILHCCGWAGIKNRMELWQDYPAKVINWAVFVEDLTIEAGREFFSGKAALGGFDNRKEAPLYSGTKDEVQRFARELVAANPAPGFLIGADCTLPADVERERLNWVVEAISE